MYCEPFDIAIASPTVGDRALSGSTASEFDIRDDVPDGQENAA
jgi:hypothetical protein